MTRENDENDILARRMGWEVIDHPRGRAHAHSSYRRGFVHVWRTMGHNGTGWMSAVLRDPVGQRRYAEHQRHELLADALRRTG